MSANPQKLIKNSVYLYVRMILVLAINLYATRLLLRYLGVDDFGIYNVVGSIVIFVSFLRQALTNATSRYLTFEIGKNNLKRLNEVYAMAINCHVALSLILVFLLEVVGVYFLNNYLTIPANRLIAANWIFQFSVLTFGLSVIQTPFNANIIAHEKMDAYAFIGISEILMKLVIVISLAYCSIDRLIYYGGMMMLSAIIVFLMYVFYCLFKLKETRFSWFWNLKLIKEFSSYSGLSLLVNGADVCSQQCFAVFFNQILGLAANAALGIANQVNSGMLAFTTNLQQAYNPQIVKSYAAGNYSYFFKLIFAATKISFILQLLISVPVVLNIDYVLSVWLGKYPKIAPDLIRVIVLFYLFDAFQYPLIQAVHANGNIKIHQIMMSSIKLLVIPVFYLVLRITDSAILAYSVWVIGGVLCAITRTIYMRSLICLDLKKYLCDVVVRIFVMALIVVLFTTISCKLVCNNFVCFLVSTGISTSLIAIVSIAWVFNKEEKQFLTSIPFFGQLLAKVI